MATASYNEEPCRNNAALSRVVRNSIREHCVAKNSGNEPRLGVLEYFEAVGNAEPFKRGFEIIQVDYYSPKELSWLITSGVVSASNTSSTYLLASSSWNARSCISKLDKVDIKSKISSDIRQNFC